MVEIHNHWLSESLLLIQFRAGLFLIKNTRLAVNKLRYVTPGDPLFV